MQQRSIRRVTWTSPPAIGIEELDADHQAIIARVRALVSALDDESSGASVDHAFTEMITALEDHIRREEDYLEKLTSEAGVAHWRRHCQFHNFMVGTLRHAYTELAKDVRAERTRAMFRAVLERIIEELFTSDEEMIDLFRKEGVTG